MKQLLSNRELNYFIMKRYKLIKEYPGSPPLDTIASKGMGIQFDYPNGDAEGFSSSKGKDFETLIENQPEFWEEVIEKEYEILSIAADHIKYICTDKNAIKNFLDKTGMSLYKIHSVKRLSDGEVFTVGEIIEYSYNYRDNRIINKNYTIEKIYLLNDGIRFYLGDGLNVGITQIVKLNKPLFTTEDGVDIYDNNYKLFEVILNNFHLNENIPLIACNNSLDKRKDGYPSKVFSTKEAAEDYIIMNKPCLSLSDVYSTFSKFNQVIYVANKKLRELVKSRL